MATRPHRLEGPPVVSYPGKYHAESFFLFFQLTRVVPLTNCIIINYKINHESPGSAQQINRIYMTYNISPCV